MKRKSNPLRSLIALVLLITSIMSLSSCAFDPDIYWEIIENGGIGDGNQSDETEEIIASGFLPGSGSVSTENVPPLQKTMLSTVVIVSNFIVTSTGSGLIYKIDRKTGDAYIITNYHVICSQTEGVCQNIDVYLYGMLRKGYEIKATLLGGSVNYDIAVLKISGNEVLKNSYAEAATFSDSDKVQIFDTVYTVGNAEGKGFSACQGIISVESEQINVVGAAGDTIQLRVIRTDAAINLGNSGGGLYDENGGLVGIVCAKDVSSEIDNIGYAIPSNLVTNLVENITYHCDGVNMTQLNRALFGIYLTSTTSGVTIDPETGRISIAEIVRIKEVNEGVAKNILMVDDIIKSVTIDGKTKEITRTNQVPDFLLSARIGSLITVVVERAGEIKSFDFTVTKDMISLEK